MRWPLVALVVCLPPAWIVAGEPTFPYKAHIAGDDVNVRSGPGENYYPTDTLRAGDLVEVYRHAPGGWCAIRPPTGSFSLVAGHGLQIQQDHLATVTEDRLAVRVGSRVSSARDVIQVRLHRGEVVEVLDAKHVGPEGSESAETWYEIAPPAGEFRWVPGGSVATDLPRDGPRQIAPGGPITVPIGGPTSSDNRQLTTAPGSGPLLEPIGGPAAKGSGPAADPVPAVPRHQSAEDYQKTLDDLEVELSIIVAEEPALWDLGDVHRRAQVMLSQAETPLERGRARLLSAKIGRFEDIKQRSDKLAAARLETLAADRHAQRLPSGNWSAADPDGRFDAMGQLTRVAASKPGAPQYAVVDAGGNVRCYVSPAPGVNLRSYVGQQVGVNGIRGYMPEQRATHLVARHISVVDQAGNATILR